MLLDVVKVTPQQDYTLLLEFENGEQRRFVFGDLIERRPFNQLKDSSHFFAASVRHGTVAWPGDVDIAPETLYALSTHVAH